MDQAPFKLGEPFSFEVTPKNPLLMGIVNITPDSFSDGGQCLDPHRALDHAQKLIDQGADLLDLGAESSRPGAKPVSLREELERIMPAVTLIRKNVTTPLSIDTYKYEVMQRVLGAGVDIINDIKGMTEDTRIPALIASHDANIVIMHMKGNPQTMQRNVLYDDIFGSVCSFLKQQVKTAIRFGIKESRICIDPGIGFGKSVSDNYSLINGLDSLRARVNQPVLVGLSKKSLIHETLKHKDDAIVAPMSALHAICLERGADILRVHDMIDAINVRGIYRELHRQ